MDAGLIERFHYILLAISSGKRINIKAFREYCESTAEEFVTVYPWVVFKPTVHRLLFHGADIIASNSFAISELR